MRGFKGQKIVTSSIFIPLPFLNILHRLSCQTKNINYFIKLCKNMSYLLKTIFSIPVLEHSLSILVHSSAFHTRLFFYIRKSISSDFVAKIFTNHERNDTDKFPFFRGWKCGKLFLSRDYFNSERNFVRSAWEIKRRHGDVT